MEKHVAKELNHWPNFDRIKIFKSKEVIENRANIGNYFTGMILAKTIKNECLVRRTILNVKRKIEIGMQTAL